MLEPVDVLRSEHLPGPARGAAGHRVEVLQRKLPAASAVVIAPDKGLAQAAHAFNDFVRRRPIAHHVAQIPDQVVLRRGLEHGVERIDVGVDIGNE